MHPILFQIGDFPIHTYGLMLAVAFLVCTFLLSKDFTKASLDSAKVYDLMISILVGGLLGAKIFYVMISWGDFTDHWEPLLSRSGLAWQGGFAGGLLGGFWFVKKHALPLRIVMDLASPYIALGQAIGRLGCFAEGCCYGKPASWGLYFPVHHAHLHPTQLYETAMLFAAFLFLRQARNFRLPDGMVFVLYMCLAAAERFIVEFFRADHGGLLWGLSLFQYIAIGIFIAAGILFFRFKR